MTRCQHCGTAFPTKRPDRRKWCDRCRELKSHLALGLYPRTCIVCERDFYARQFRQSMCPECSGSPVGRDGCDGEKCTFCDRSDRLLPGVALCFPCAARGDEGHHKRVMSSMTKALRKVRA